LLTESGSKSCGVVCGGGEVSSVACSSESAQPGVDLHAPGGIEDEGDAIADPLEHGHGAGDAACVPGRGVNPELLRPEVETLGVDLGGRPVPQLEVERGLGDVDGFLGNPSRVLNPGRVRQRAQVPT
jgi:hypothetical protein